MESKGKLVSASIDIQTQRKLLTFAVENCSEDEINRLAKQETLDIRAVRHTKKRSLNANAYFHVLVGKIAEALMISKAHAKNMEITKYGQRMYAGDDLACIKTNLTIEQVQEMEEPHLKFVKFNEDGNAYYYYIYRGSHTYDSVEMSKLIDGTVADAKELGIETLSPAELERMKHAWESTISTRKQGSG